MSKIPYKQKSLTERHDLKKSMSHTRTKTDMEFAAYTAKNIRKVKPKLPQTAIDMANGKLMKEGSREERIMDATIALIAQSEDFLTKPKKGKDGYWYIGFGSGWHPSGRRVRATDRISSREEAIAYAKKALEENDKYLKKYLPLDKMTEDERAVFNSLVYNCGHTVLGADGKPSALVRAFCKWKESGLTKDKEALRLLYKQTKVYSAGRPSTALKKRRDLEARILVGDITIDNTGKSKKPNAIDLDNVKLAAIYSIGALPKDSVQLVKKLEAFEHQGKKSLAQMLKPRKKVTVNNAVVRKRVSQGRA